MATYTKLRMSALSASMPSDGESAAASSGLAVSDLAGTLDHMASAIKRIHGASSFTENVPGEFLSDVVLKGTTPKLTIGDGGAEDTMLVFDGNAVDYRIGLDDGTDMLEFGVGSAHGTTTALAILSNQQVDVIGDLTVGDDLTLFSDDSILKFGSDAEVSLTHVHNSGLLLGGANNKLQFRDSAIFIASDADGHMIAEADTGVTLAINNTARAEITSAGLEVIGSITIGSAAMSEADLEQLDGITAGTVAASKAVVVDANKDAASFRNLTATGAVTAGSFVIGSADMSEVDLEKLDGITNGTAAANKALVVDGNIDITTLRNVTATGVVTAAGFTIGSATIVEAELEMIDGITAGTAAALKAVVLDGSKNIATIGTVGCGAITSTGTSTLASLVITGDLTVEGTQTALNTTQVNVEDKQMRLGIPGGMTIDGDATYTLTSNVVTVTNSSHGLTNGQFVYISDPAPTAVITEGVYEITSVADVNTFTFAFTASNVGSATAINHSADDVTNATGDGSGIFVSVASTTPTGIEWDTTNGWQILGGDLDISASKNLSFAGTSILADSAGTMTLSNVDALDATTEATVEAAIDTLPNLTSAAALVTVSTLGAGAISSGFGNIDNGSSTLDTGVGTLASLVCTAGATFGGGLGSSGVTISTSGAISADARIVTDDATEATSTTDGSLQTDGGLSVAKSAVIGDDLDLLSNGAILKVGVAQPFTLTHSNASNTLMASSGHRLAFGDAGEYITGDGTNLSVISSADIILDPAGGDVSVDGNVVPDSDATDSLGSAALSWAAVYADAFDLNGNTGGLVLDADGDSKIYSLGDDSIDIRTGGVDRLAIIDSSMSPAPGIAFDLGTTSNGFDALHMEASSVLNFDGGDVVWTHAAGKLTLSGDGAVELDFGNHEMTNVDIDSGAIDGAIIGAASAAAGTFTTLDCTDGAFAVANLDIDGATDIGAALVDADLFMVDDGAGGTNRKCAMSRVRTFLGSTKQVKVFTAVLAANAAYDTGMTGADFAAAPTASGGGANTTEVYINGMLLMGGTGASANKDYYEHGDGAGNIAFEFGIQVDDVLTVIVR